MKVEAGKFLVKADADGDLTDSVAISFLAALRDSVKTEDGFKSVAEQYGQDGAAAHGGDLGYVGRGRMVHEFDSAVLRSG